MPVSDDYLNFILESLESSGEVAAKRMFGGVGLYMDDLIFAIIENDCLRFKVDETNRTDYTDAGMEPFKPYKDKDHTMQYYEVPVEILEDSEELAKWALKAVSVARSAALKKPKRQKKAKKSTKTSKRTK